VNRADAEFLVKLGAYRDDRLSVYKFDGLAAAWRGTENGRWLFWLATVAGAPAKEVAAAMADAAEPFLAHIDSKEERARCAEALQADRSGAGLREAVATCRRVADHAGASSWAWAAALTVAEPAEYLERREAASSAEQLRKVAEMFGREVYRQLGNDVADDYGRRAAKAARERISWSDVDAGLRALR
jgi:hypothetical protein